MQVRQPGRGSVLTSCVLVAAALSPGLPAVAAPPGNPAADQATSWTVNGPSGASPVAAQVASTTTAGSASASATGTDRAGPRRRRASRPPTANLTQGPALPRPHQPHRGRALHDDHRQAPAAASTLDRDDVLIRQPPADRGRRRGPGVRDGAAYRYVLPASALTVTRRGLVVHGCPPGRAAWLLPYTPNYENTRVETTASGARRATTASRRCSRSPAATPCSPSPTWTAGTRAPG